MPLLIKIVLSTAHIDRVKTFDLLLNNDGVLNTNIIMQSLNVSKPTALRTMLELQVIGLVDKSEDVYDSTVRNNVKHFYLNRERYGWFLTEDFRTLREGFIPVDYSKVAAAAAEAAEVPQEQENGGKEEEKEDDDRRLLKEGAN